MKNQVTKKYFQWAVLVFAGVLAVSCSNDDKGVEPETNSNNASKGLQFKVEFSDYNTDTEVQATRTGESSSDTLSKKIVDLGNGLLAEMTIQRDTTKTITSREQTRALENGTYTMLAYQGGVYKGEVTGTVESHSYPTGALDPWGYPIYAWGTFFHYANDQALELEPGTYDFVLYNNKVTRNGNELSVDYDNRETALVARTTHTLTATPKHQQITFQMKHVSSRLRYKWISYAPIQNPVATLTQIDPLKARYDATTGNWSTGATLSTSTDKMVLTSTTTPDAEGYYTATSSYIYYMPATYFGDQSFTMGSYQGQESTTYNEPINIEGSPSDFATESDFAPNTSHLITFKILLNKAWYLMSDGSIGGIGQTTFAGGTKTPIAVVVSRSQKLAVALKDAAEGMVNWSSNMAYIAHQINFFMWPYTPPTTVFNDMNGYKYTWEPSGSIDNTTIKANSKEDFPAFYYAGHYGDKLAAKGITVGGKLVGRKWHLPSDGEWKYVLTGLGGVNAASLSYNPFQEATWNGFDAEVFFLQVGGNLQKDTYNRFWTSGEFNTIDGGGIHFTFTPYSDPITTTFGWAWQAKNVERRARAFIKYDD